MESLNTQNKIIQDNRKVFNFFKMKNGSSITCHGRPKKNDIQFLHKNHGVNYILTLQHEGEKPESIKKDCEKVHSSIKWHHFPLKGANMALLMSKDTQKMIFDNIFLLLNEMKNNTLTIFVHCAAGVHRTGIIVYTLLRITGESKERAMEAIKQIRIETFRKCGDNRIHYAEEFLVQPLLKLIKNDN